MDCYSVVNVRGSTFSVTKKLLQGEALILVVLYKCSNYRLFPSGNSLQFTTQQLFVGIMGVLSVLSLELPWFLAFIRTKASEVFENVQIMVF